MNLNYVVDVFSRLNIIRPPKIKVDSTHMSNAVCYLSPYGPTFIYVKKGLIQINIALPVPQD